MLYEDKSVTLNLVSTVMMSSLSNGRYSSVLVVSEQAWQVCMSVCAYVCVHLYCMYVQMSVYMCVHLCIHLYLSADRSMCLCIYVCCAILLNTSDVAQMTGNDSRTLIQPNTSL